MNFPSDGIIATGKRDNVLSARPPGQHLWGGEGAGDRSCLLNLP